ncbi:MAG TPA: metallophosphoesterase family protein [Bryobacteraceae bacterium]|nr:metallophosphoesterase family protein [Bryobacteraceae bacterium]
MSRTLVHISDIHFGRIHEPTVEPLIRQITSMNPDVLVVSGDLTQRAKSEEFREARRFLDRLPSPQVVVPGNHDVPLYNVYGRFVQQLDRYRRYISEDLQPAYIDDEIAVLGVNTARAFTWKGGRINDFQIAELHSRLCAIDDRVVKVVVTHHPFDLPEHFQDSNLVGRARTAMRHLAACGADLLLAGHFHISHTGCTARRYQISGHSAVIVQAGTATSSRGRGEYNSFNKIIAEPERLVVERWTWIAGTESFNHSAADEYRYTQDGWMPVLCSS